MTSKLKIEDKLLVDQIERQIQKEQKRLDLLKNVLKVAKTFKYIPGDLVILKNDGCGIIKTQILREYPGMNMMNSDGIEDILGEDWTKAYCVVNHENMSYYREEDIYPYNETAKTLYRKG